jgi:predicted nucleic acid binding AN1-type Zn finger protein
MSCNFADCKKKQALLVGDCKYCDKHFCGTHRLPESHKCEELEKCKKIQFEKNKEKLMGERTTDHRLRS